MKFKRCKQWCKIFFSVYLYRENTEAVGNMVPLLVVTLCIHLLCLPATQVMAWQDQVVQSFITSIF